MCFICGDRQHSYLHVPQVTKHRPYTSPSLRADPFDLAQRSDDQCNALFFAEYGSVSSNFSNAFFEAVSGITTTGVFPRVYDDRLLDDEVIGSVVAFFTVFFLCFFVLTVLLMAFGLDFLTSASGAATALANVGPGLGEIIGPTNNFAPLPDGAKWLLSLGMLLGRLELFTVLILFVPRFWR